MFIGFAFLSISAFWQLYNNQIPLMLKGLVGDNNTLVGFIMALDNILALFLLPFFGQLSDKTISRFGKRTPYIIIGSLCAVTFMILIPLAYNLGSALFFS